MNHETELEQAVDFLQQLIRIRSLPGEEGALAIAVRDKMNELGYDTRFDAAGNVIGEIAGRGDAPPLAFNTHLDHVDVGDSARWPYPPYGGERHDGKIWGRGTVDIKGPLVAQLFGAAPAGSDAPPGRVSVTMVVQEEVGGLGARHLSSYLADDLGAAAVVVGEPSRNTVRRGHRGRAELVAHFIGRSVHASVPELGANPLPSLGRFLSRLDELQMKSHPALGNSTLVPTLLSTDQSSANVIPAEVWQTLDWRWVPAEEIAEMTAQVSALLATCLGDGIRGEVTVPAVERRSYTGLEMTHPADNPAYVLEPDHPWLTNAERIVSERLGDRRATTSDGDAPGSIWQFATDGGHFAQRGIAPIGFGPGDERLAHTLDEHIAIEQLAQAIEINRAFARELALAAG